MNTAANRVSALGVDGEEDYDEDVEPVHTEEGFSALQRCLDTGLAACALADTLLSSIRCSEQWRDEADVLGCVAQVYLVAVYYFWSPYYILEGEL